MFTYRFTYKSSQCLPTKSIINSINILTINKATLPIGIIKTTNIRDYITQLQSIYNTIIQTKMTTAFLASRAEVNSKLVQQKLNNYTTEMFFF